MRPTSLRKFTCFGSGARVGIGHKRYQKFGVGNRKGKIRGQNAYQGITCAVQFERLADDAGVATESSLPKPVRDDRDPGSARAVIFGPQSAPDGRVHAKCLEQVCGNAQAVQSFSVTPPGHVRAPAAHGGDRIEGAGVVAIVDKVR